MTKKDKNLEEKSVIEKHYYHYIPYPVYVNHYPWSPNIHFPQYPTAKPIWLVTPESYTWTTTTNGTGVTIC